VSAVNERRAYEAPGTAPCERVRAQESRTAVPLPTRTFAAGVYHPAKRRLRGSEKENT
jgi:hypothetical protein